MPEALEQRELEFEPLTRLEGAGDTVRAVCPHDCWDTCSLVVHRRGGRVHKVAGDPQHPVTGGFVCVKVNHYPERIYSPDRVLYPQLRVGPKGSGSFREASWEEALATIATRWREIIARHGPEAILPYSYAGTMGLLNGGSLDRRFFNYLGASRLRRTICSSAGGEALRLTLGARLGADPEGMRASRLIIAWGINILTTNVHQWPIILEARKRGATLVVIDPYRHQTARRADWHLSPRPGTDAALALGLMHVLIDEDLYDKAYVERFTLGFDALAGRVAQYPPRRVEEITGVSEGDIRRLARLYATARPSVIRLGYGIQRHTNGGQTVRTIAALPALVGSWGEAGGGLLLSNSDAFPLDQAALERPDLTRGNPREINMIQLGRALLEADPPVQSLYVYNSNPAAVAPEQGLVLRGLAREDLFTVVHEQLMTDTAAYADVVLPATTQFEHLDLHASYWHLYLQLNRPAIAPLGEAKPNTEVFRLLARAMGFDEPALQDSDEELIRQALSVDHPHLAGITLERLRREHSIRLNLERPFVPFRQGFPTPSGKVELYSPRLAERGLDPLPGYQPPAESREADPGLFGRYPLHFLTPSAHHFLNSSFANLPALLLKEGQPTLFINPLDAAERGIASGDRVRVYNDRGECLLMARIGDQVQPGVVLSPSLWWSRSSPGERNVNATTSAREADYGGGAVFHTNLVEVEPASPGRGVN